MTVNLIEKTCEEGEEAFASLGGEHPDSWCASNMQVFIFVSRL